ncbi:MATE family efflux transporter [Thorsellia kenyensis]|uniref:MATE family efflux transporter n=1 Tax=Thorsellia kenyensis TaxID=1549888 RepID=A0ABV6CAW4_9GAMM
MIKLPQQNEQSSVRSKDVKPLNLLKIFMVFLLPMLLSNFLQGLSGTLNNIFVSQMIGDKAFAALSAFFPVVFLMISIVIGLGAGGSILVGQAFGAGNLNKVKSITGTTLSLNFLLGIVFAVLGGLFLDELLVLLKTPDDLFLSTKHYAYVMLLNIPFIFLFICFTSLLRGAGDSLTPLLALIVSTLLGVCLTPIFILGPFGLPSLGIMSPALAILFANIMTMSLLIYYLKKTRHILAFTREFLSHLMIKISYLKIIFKISIPMTVQMITIAVSELLIVRLINTFGSDATTSYGAMIQILGYVQFPAISIAITVSILGAQAIGRGELALLKKITLTGLLVNLLLTGGLVLFILFFSDFIVRFFISDLTTIKLTKHILMLTLWGMIIFGFARVFAAIMQSSGIVLIPTLINVIVVIFIQLPIAGFLDNSFGLTGVWLSYPIAFSIMLLMQFSYYWFSWRHKTITRLI